MTKVYSAPDRSLRETLEDLGSAESVNWRVHLLIGVPFLLSAVTLEQVRFGGEVAGWLLFGLIFWALTALILETLFLITKKRSWAKSRPAAVIGLLVATGFIRGGLIYFSGAQLNLIPETDLLYRLLVGPIFVSASYATMNVIVSNYLRDTKLNQELQFRQFELRFFESNLKQQISQLREALLEKVNNQLRPQLRKVFRKLNQDKSKTDLQDSVALLLEIVDETVRPLSRDLALTRAIPKPSSLKPRANPLLIKFPKKIILGSMIPIPLVALLYLLLGFPSLAVLSDPLTALRQIAVVGTLNIGVFGLAKLATNRFAVRPILGLGIVVAISLVASSVSLLIEGLVSLNLNDRFAFQTYVFNGSMILTLYAYQLIKTQVVVAQEELQEVVRKLELLASALRQEAWVIQRNVATVLHGPVQAAMYSAAMRLSQAKRPSAVLIAAIKKEIDLAIARLAKPDFLEGENLEEVLKQIQELWDGIARITIDLDDQLAKNLHNKPIPTQCAIEIAREGVSNAIKHGKAKKIAISISLANSDMLRVSVANDGLSPQQKNQYGVGTALLNDLSHEWDILSNENQTELVAMVSLAQRN